MTGFLRAIFLRAGLTAHRPFVPLSAALCAGIVFAQLADVPVSALALVAFIPLAVAIRMPRLPGWATVFLLLSVMGLGAVCAQARRVVPEDDIARIARYTYGNSVAVEGVIVSDVQQREALNSIRTTFTLAVSRVRTKWGWKPRKGSVLVHAYGRRGLAYGDRILTEGKLHRPYNFSPDRNFSYREYLARRNIRYILSIKKAVAVEVLGRGLGNPVRRLSVGRRNRLKDVLTEYLSPNEAGLMAAILLGDRSGIPQPVRKLFVQTGTAHILAISGLHMGIVAGLFLIFVKVLPVGRRGRLATVIVMICAFAFMTGGRPSVTRAAVMTSVFLASFIVEKEFDMLNTLCLAAFIILMVNPLNLFDAGFQLSFACVFAIAHAEWRLRATGKSVPRRGYGPERPRPGRWAGLVRHSLYFSFVIWVGVAGLVAYHFGIITPVTVLANVFVIPLITMIVALGFGLLSFGSVWPAASAAFAVCLKVILNVMVGLIFLMDKIPFAHMYVVRQVLLWHAAVYYAALFCLAAASWRFRKLGQVQ